MKRHERSHYGKEQHQCPRCSRSFARKDNIRKHQSRCRGQPVVHAPTAIASSYQQSMRELSNREATPEFVVPINLAHDQTCGYHAEAHTVTITNEDWTRADALDASDELSARPMLQESLPTHRLITSPDDYRVTTLSSKQVRMQHLSSEVHLSTADVTRTAELEPRLRCKWSSRCKCMGPCQLVKCECRDIA